MNLLLVHPDEVDGIQWVSYSKLLEQMEDKNLLFSPWFRLIVKKWLGTWWKDLKTCMTTQKYCDYDHIQEFDPPAEHLGGGGDAGPLFDKTNGTELQGDAM